MQYMKAKQLSRRREVRDNGAVVEVVIWELPAPLPPCSHAYKYRLAFVVKGICEIRYDNERGKGDHRHCAGREEPYVFVSLDRLLADFRSDVEAWK